MDRILYREAPMWAEGTFEQADEYEGVLHLHVDGLQRPDEVASSLARLDLVAERFRLAISRRTGCPLKMSVVRTGAPHFDEGVVVTLTDSVAASDSAESTVAPRVAPAQIEQMHAGAARWVHTLTEARTMGAYQEEVLKRLFLIIEELKDIHLAVLSSAEVASIDELALVRDFVSHPICDRKKVPPFIAARLPSAVISVGPPLAVRYDSSDVEHRNFVGRYDPVARRIANKLIEAAISALP